MRRSSLVTAFLAAGLLTAWTGCHSKQEPGAGGASAGSAGAVDVSYVSPDFFTAVVIHPARIAKSAVVAPLLKDEFIASKIKEGGIDPLQIEQLLLLVPTPAPPNDPSRPREETPGVIVRFAQAVDAKEMVTKFFKATMPQREMKVEETTFEGKKCCRVTGGPEPLIVYAPNDRTVLLAVERNMRKMLSASGASSPLVERLRQIEADHDAIVAVALDPVRPMVKDAVREMQRGAPPPLVPIIAAAEQLKGATVSLKLEGGTLLKAVVEGGDADNAGKLEKALKDGLEQAKTQVAEMRKGMPEPMLKQFGPALDLADAALAGIEIRTAGKEVTVALKRPAEMDKKVAQLAEMATASLKEARGAAQRMAKLNNVKQIGFAMMMYENMNRTLPPAAIRSKDGKPLLSWRVAILPMIDEAALYKKFKLDEPWDSPTNIDAAQQMPKVYQSAEHVSDGKTTIMVFTGPGTLFAGEKGMSLSEIKDGASNTLLVVEAGPDKAVPWAKPEDLPFDREDPIAALGQIPTAGFGVVFCDGHVMTLKRSIDPKTLRALITPAGGERVNEGDLKGL